MNASALALSAYGPRSTGAQSARDTEYQVFVKVTGALAAAVARASFPALAKAAHDNIRLWTALAVDVASDDNALPVPLRGQIIGLARFTVTHTQKVLREEADARVLIEINQVVMKGLRVNLAGAP